MKPQKYIRTKHVPARFVALALAVVMPPVLLPSSRADDELALSRATIDGGGVMRATGDDFEISGTVGQPDAGVMTGGDYVLAGGFWFELDPGDCNEDGAANVNDMSRFAACMLGPSGGASTGCACTDFDGDGHTDLRDFAELQISVVPP